MFWGFFPDALLPWLCISVEFFFIISLGFFNLIEILFQPKQFTLKMSHWP